jgi:LmbE family N-acetylglucosaminyl deacetylase
MRILIVAAHPDDEVLGCGGTTAALSTTNEVHIVILGEGMSSRYGARAEVDTALIEQLRSDADRARDIVGAQSLVLEKLPDNRFDQVGLLDVVKRVEANIARLRPEIIYTHHPADLNIDHSVTHRAVLTATRPTVDCGVIEILAFEVPSSTEWNFGPGGTRFNPNVFVDVATTIDVKIHAMEAYSTESRSFPHPRSAEALRARARHWGAVAGLEYAEAFEMVRSIRRQPGSASPR